MNKLKLLLLSFHTLVVPAYAADVQTNGNSLAIRPDGGQARVIRLEIINDQIIRVRATSKEQLPDKPASLMIVPQTSKAKGTIADEGETMVVKTARVKAVVEKTTGSLTFYDAKGKQLLQEVKDGKQFWDFTVPECELGIKGGKQPTQQQRHGHQRRGFLRTGTASERAV